MIALCGDGGFSMLMGELLTVAGLDIPVKLMIFNNSTLGMVRAEMMVVGYEPFGTDVVNPDLGALATSAMPPEVTVEEVKGFALTTSKLVFNHEVAEVWGQVKSNVRDVSQAL